MSGLRFLSVCSGLEGASLALDPLGWTAAGFAEIEAFPSAIIAARYGSNLPGEPLSGNAPPNFGDFTAIDLSKLGPVDLLIGGTPCQAFSIAGKRLSLADSRGNLSLAYTVLAHELARSHGLRNALWENVPGVLNTPDNAFGCFLGALVGSECAIPGPKGRGWPNFGMVRGARARAAWIVRDAQFFGLAQRRERVFVVADFGNGADPAAVLFEPQGVRGNTPPSRETRQSVAPTLSARTKGGGGLGTDFDLDGGLVAAFGGGNRSGPVEQDATLTAKGHRSDFEVETFIAHSLRGEAFDASEDGTGRGTPLVPVAFPANLSGTQYASTEDLSPALKAKNPTAIAFTSKDSGGDASTDLAPTLRAMGHGESWANGGGQVAVAFDTTQITSPGNYSAPKPGDPVHPLAAGAHPPAVAFAIQERAVSENPDAGPDGMGVQEGIAYTLEARQQVQAVAFAQNTRDEVRLQNGDGSISGALAADPGMKQTTYVAVPEAVAFDLRGREGGAQFEGPHDTANIRAASGGSSRSYVAERWAVRRLTPTECERLQGVPDGWTMIPWRGKPADQCPDGNRYRALGNSWAVPVVRWIGERLTNALLKDDKFQTDDQIRPSPPSKEKTPVFLKSDERPHDPLPSRKYAD